MAGSRKWFVYTTDSGTNYALQADESNVEEAMAGTQDFLDNATFTDALPRNIKPRMATYSNTDGTRNIRIPILTQTVYGGLRANKATIADPLGAVNATLSLTLLSPERIKLPRGQDTGLNDGDAS